MREREIVMKDYMADPEVFADAFTCFLYGGGQVISDMPVGKQPAISDPLHVFLCMRRETAFSL